MLIKNRICTIKYSLGRRNLLGKLPNIFVVASDTWQKFPVISGKLRHGPQFAHALQK